MNGYCALRRAMVTDAQLFLNYGGRPCMRGLRISVYGVLSTLRSSQNQTIPCPAPQPGSVFKVHAALDKALASRHHHITASATFARE